MSLQKALHFWEGSNSVSLKSCTRWSHDELPPMTINTFFPESGPTLVFPWYLEFHCLPRSPFQHSSWWVSLYTVYLQGISLQAVGKDRGGGLGAEAEASGPLPGNTGNRTPEAPPATPGPSLSLQEEEGCREG